MILLTSIPHITNYVIELNLRKACLIHIQILLHMLQSPNLKQYHFLAITLFLSITLDFMNVHLGDDQ